MNCELDKEYLQKYEEELTQKLLRQAHDLRCGAEQLYHTEDLEEMWHKIAPQYMVDAVPEIAQYPTVAIAWAGYIGMALAHLWDKDWDEVLRREDVYASLRDPRGFDEMDEYIIEGVMGYLLDSKTAQGFETSCARSRKLHWHKFVTRKSNLKAKWHSMSLLAPRK